MEPTTMAYTPDTIVIDDFMDHWSRGGRTFIKGVAKVVEEICNKTLEELNVPCIVKSRAKDRESLRKKLLSRNRHRMETLGPYRKRADIYDDVRDLGGVRIALYFPRQRKEVESFIDSHFRIVGKKIILSEHSREKDSPTPRDQDPAEYHWKFPRYEATHYHVQLKENDLKKHDLSVEEPDTIELQVMTVLRSAWSEVEHDRVYKDRITVSIDDKRVIDALGGVIYMGEYFLDQLYDGQTLKEMAAEREFKNVHEIGVEVSKSMFKAAKEINPTAREEDQNLGPILALKKLLEVLQMNRRKHLHAMVEDVYQDLGSTSIYSSITKKYEPFKLTASVYIMDHILRREHENVQKALEASQEAEKLEDLHLHRLKVMASAMIWLDEFFVPFSDWSGKLFSHKVWESDRHEKCLLWLDSAKVTMTLQKASDLGQEDRSMVDDLWDWFETHPESVVQFTFKIAKLGVLRSFPEETHLLGRVYVLIHRSLNPLLLARQ